MSNDKEPAVREHLMWLKISSEFNWTEELLAKYANYVNWSAISANEQVCWTESLIQRFTSKLDWFALSCNMARVLADPQLVRPFAKSWCWRYKTGTTAWTPEFINEMKNYIDWDQLLRPLPIERQDELISQYADNICRDPLPRPRPKKKEDEGPSYWFRRKQHKHDKIDGEVIVLAD